jgi:competence protein ComEC
MAPKQGILVRIVIGCAVICFLGYREWVRLPDGHVHIVFFDVGQGDSALVTSAHGRQILIDGGPDWAALEHVGATLPFFDRSIDMIVLSHPHLDHLASLPEILERYHVGTLVISGVGNDAPWMQRILTIARRRGTRVMTGVAGQRMELDGLTLDVLWPPRTLAKQFTTNLNNVSVVIKLKTGTHSALFSGDMEKMVEDTLVAAHADLRAEVLKVPHHGGKTSSSTGVLLAIKPAVAIVSTGSGNSYGHPNRAVIQRLESMGIRVHRTDLQGSWNIVW